MLEAKVFPSLNSKLVTPINNKEEKKRPNKYFSMEELKIRL